MRLASPAGGRDAAELLLHRVDVDLVTAGLSEAIQCRLRGHAGGQRGQNTVRRGRHVDVLARQAGAGLEEVFAGHAGTGVRCGQSRVAAVVAIRMVQLQALAAHRYWFFSFLPKRTLEHGERTAAGFFTLHRSDASRHEFSGSARGTGRRMRRNPIIIDDQRLAIELLGRVLGVLVSGVDVRVRTGSGFFPSVKSGRIKPRAATSRLISAEIINTGGAIPAAVRSRHSVDVVAAPGHGLLALLDARQHAAQVSSAVQASADQGSGGGGSGGALRGGSFFALVLGIVRSAVQQRALVHAHVERIQCVANAARQFREAVLREVAEHPHRLASLVGRQVHNKGQLRGAVRVRDADIPPMY
eukprot:Colp12_sorted_trinity150504_noHs@32910